MDGHECPDVVEYRDKVFLPSMEEYKARMVKYKFVADGQPLRRVPPVLGDSEKEIIPIFQDKSCFHVNKYKSKAW